LDAWEINAHFACLRFKVMFERSGGAADIIMCAMLHIESKLENPSASDRFCRFTMKSSTRCSIAAAHAFSHLRYVK
jgi:hypothetical protein